MGTTGPRLKLKRKEANISMVKRVKVYVLNSNAGTLKAKADVTLAIGEMEIGINSCRIIQSEGKDPWVGFPQEKYRSGTDDKYKEIIFLNLPARVEITKSIISEYSNLINKQ